MKAEQKPEYGQIVERELGTRNQRTERRGLKVYERRGCGSSPDRCGHSCKLLGVVGGPFTRCTLSQGEEPPGMYTNALNEYSGRAVSEHVVNIYCASEKPTIIEWPSQGT